MALIPMMSFPNPEGTCPLTGEPVRDRDGTPTMRDVLFNRHHDDRLEAPRLAVRIGDDLFCEELARMAATRSMDLHFLTGLPSETAQALIKQGLREYAGAEFRRLVEALPSASVTSNDQAHVPPNAAQELGNFLLEGIDLKNFKLGSKHSAYVSMFNCAAGELGVDDAALCLSDAVRTKRFIEALDAHLDDLLREKRGEIVVVDAGCGPLPIFGLWAALKDPRIKVVCIEAQELSNEIAAALVNKLRLGDQISVSGDDAALWTSARPIDLLISETMHAGFAQEDFPGLMRNLCEQLGPGARTVPEMVTAEYALVPKSRHEAASEFKVFHSKQACPIIAGLEWRTAVEWRPGVAVEKIRAEVELPAGEEPHALLLRSRIDLYTSQGRAPITLEPMEAVITGSVKIDVPWQIAEVAGSHEFSYNAGQAHRGSWS